MMVKTTKTSRLVTTIHPQHRVLFLALFAATVVWPSRGFVVPNDERNRNVVCKTAKSAASSSIDNRQLDFCGAIYHSATTGRDTARSSSHFPFWLSNNSENTESSMEEEEPSSEENNNVSSIASSPVDDTDQKNIFQRLRRKYFSKPDDGLTFKQRLSKAGLAVALSYGWVSNVAVAISVSLSWYIFNQRTGLSPLAPGQWKGFLAVYAGIYVVNNVIRPLRFGLSVGVSVYFDRAIKKIQEVLNVNKGVAIFITVFLANIVGTCSLIACGVSLASFASGVPIFVPKP